MKNKKLFFSGLTFALALAVLGGLALPTYAATNYSNDNGNNTSLNTTITTKLKNHRKLTSAQLAVVNKNKAAINAALAANDYNAWLTAVGPNSAIAKKITAANFPQLVQIYQLKLQIMTLMTNLGLKNGMMMGGTTVSD